MGQLGAQTVKDHLKRLVAQDPVKNKNLLDHYESLKGYSAKLNFALQLKVDRDGSFMTATEVHSTASMDKSGFEDGWLEDSIVASKSCKLFWCALCHTCQIVSNLSVCIICSHMALVSQLLFLT